MRDLLLWLRDVWGRLAGDEPAEAGPTDRPARPARAGTCDSLFLPPGAVLIDRPRSRRLSDGSLLVTYRLRVGSDGVTAVPAELAKGPAGSPALLFGAN